MAYTIISDLVGEPGTEFIPAEGINIEALLDGGFIKSDKTPTKSAKTVETSPEE
jgi:hypothetical protein